MDPPDVFHDQRETIYGLMDEVLVVCPSCAACAKIFRIDARDQSWFSARRVACARCGYAKDWATKALARRGDVPRDDFFELPLWLQTPCAGATLWAYNRRHVDYLEAFVRAKHRAQHRDATLGWSNRSLASRLPKWIQSAKNRDDVLRGVERLRARLREA